MCFEIGSPHQKVLVRTISAHKAGEGVSDGCVELDIATGQPVPRTGWSLRRHQVLPGEGETTEQTTPSK